MRPCGQRDEHVEVQVPELVGIIAVLGPRLGEDLSRLQPVSLGGRQNWMVLAKRPKKLAIGLGCGAPPKFRQNDRRIADQAAE